MQTGRIVLYTDVEEITYKNVIDVLRNAMTDHRVNAARIRYLMEYDEGNQPLKRKKKVRTDIDCHCVDNVANEITEPTLSPRSTEPSASIFTTTRLR